MEQTVYSVILDRKSYRGGYLNEAVPREKLEMIIKAGLAAPSGCNKQTTSLIAVDDAEVLERIKAVANPPVDPTVPALICVLTQKIPGHKNKLYNVQDYAAAIQNMLLLIKAMGYESCWLEGYITDAEGMARRVAEILSVPEGYELVCLLPVGRAAEPVQAAKKKPEEERAWFNGYGQ